MVSGEKQSVVQLRRQRSRRGGRRTHTASGKVRRGEQGVCNECDVEITRGGQSCF